MNWQEWRDNIDARARMAEIKQREMEANRTHPVEEAYYRSLNEMVTVSNRLNLLTEELFREEFQRIRTRRVRRNLIAVAAALFCFAAGFSAAILFLTR